MIEGALHRVGRKARAAVLFARERSVYFDLALEVYDVKRDARTFAGGLPVVAHPPCRGWGRLRSLAKVRPDELDLARFAVRMVRQCGGVLEHPEGSKLWEAESLPLRGRDRFGGYTVPVLQSWFGHRAPKSTWLYVCGVSPTHLPLLPFALGEPAGRVERMCTAERERTPVAFARWLLDLAERAR